MTISNLGDLWAKRYWELENHDPEQETEMHLRLSGGQKEAVLPITATGGQRGPEETLEAVYVSMSAQRELALDAGRNEETGVD